MVGDRSIYENQLRSRVDLPAHRFRSALPLMASIPAGDAARAPKLSLQADDLVSVGRAQLEASGVPGAPVVGRDGTFRGIVTAANLAAADPDGRVRDVADDALAISVDDGLDDALGALADHHADWAPVLADGRLVGILSARDVMGAYRRALAGNVRQVRGLGAGGVLLEADLARGSALVGATVADAGWPPDVVLVAIERGDSLIVPRGDVTLAVGDRLSLFAAPGSEAQARSLLGPGVATTDFGVPANEA